MDVTKKIRYPLVDGGSPSGRPSLVSEHGCKDCRRRVYASLLFNRKTCGIKIVTAKTYSHTAMAAISARRLVTMLLYLKGNLTAIKRSKLINAR